VGVAVGAPSVIAMTKTIRAASEAAIRILFPRLPELARDVTRRVFFITHESFYVLLHAFVAENKRAAVVDKKFATAASECFGQPE
jgi:hypothetical protein